MKPLRTWVLVGVVSSSAPALAENFAAPLRCKPSQTYLQVENPSAEVEPFWFQAIGSSPFREKYHEVPARSPAHFALSDDFTEDTTAIAIKTSRPGLQFKTICKAANSTSSVGTSRSPWKSIQWTKSVKERVVHLNLVNLSQATNAIAIYLGGELLAATIMPADFAKHEFRFRVPALAGGRNASIELRAVAAFTATAWDVALGTGNGGENAPEMAITDKTQIIPDIPAAPVRYFEFRSSSHQESFVAPMTDASMIRQSLEQIRDPETARLFIGRIEHASALAEGNPNRNLLSSTKDPWSWRVAEAQNYADFAHISCDGTPSVVEERVSDWIKSTGGTICFWNYRVHREVSPEELRQSRSSLRPDRPTLQRKR